MNLHRVLLNGKIPFDLLETSNNENVIFCKTFSDHLFNVGVFKTKTKEVILEYTTKEEEKFACVDVTLENGTHYKDVIFKIVVNEKIDTPYSTINFNILGQKSFIDLPTKPVELVEEEQEPEVACDPVLLPATTQPDYSKHIQEALKLQKALEREKQALKKEKIVLEKQDTIKKKLLEYKQELLEEYFNATKKQEEILNTSINKNLDSLESRLVDTLERYNEKLEQEELDIKSSIKIEFNDLKEKNIALVKEKIDTQIDLYKKDLEKFINEEITYNQNKTSNNLELKFSKLQESNNEKISIVLDEYKDLLHKEIFETIEEKLDQYVTTLVEEKVVKNNSNVKKKVKDEIILEIKKYIDDSVQTAKTYARRILELGGGGGSVAVQYALGGTMDGDLTVNGNVSVKTLTVQESLSVCGNILPCTNETYNLGSSALRWKDLYLSGDTIYLGDSVITSIGTTIVVPSQEVDGNVDVLDGNVNVSNGQYLSSGIDLLNIFGSSQTLTIITGNSARWDSTYTSVNENSANWVTYPFVHNNFLHASGGTVSGNLTVTGNLTALGDAYFVNTVFTTTSALSVVNIGIGPALYVYQSPGPYDIASFVDGDGVEVLHVGNAQPDGNGFVGINTGFPLVELTVNGAISSNKIITVAGGNSNNWNSVYSSVSQTSASWNSVYSSTTTNSANWDSVYNDWNAISGQYVTVTYLSTNNVQLSAATIKDDMVVGGTGYFSHVAAASKSFYIKHPIKENMHLQYGSLESPYHGIRLTGRNRVSTTCRIDLPEYISHLVTDDGVNIQLTNINHTKTLFVSEINIKNNYFVVKNNRSLFSQNREYEFFWSFTAIRKDIPNLIVEK